MAEYRLTRSELISLKGRSALAIKGCELLKKKRDVLLSEVMGLKNRVSGMKSELDGAMSRAYGGLAIASAVDGKGAVIAASMAVKSDILVDVSKKTIVGVAVPEIKISGRVLKEYGLLGISVRIDESSEQFINVLKMILDIAEQEAVMRKLSGELKNTERRINALEKVKIPGMVSASKNIEFRLEEIEREDFFRLKMLKEKLAAAAETVEA